MHVIALSIRTASRRRQRPAPRLRAAGATHADAAPPAAAALSVQPVTAQSTRHTQPRALTPPPALAFDPR